MDIKFKEIIKKGLELEKSRRSPPFDDKSHSLNYDNANKIYMEFLLKHGVLILEELNKNCN